MRKSKINNHLNYDIRGNLNYNPFPTMVMDWTEDIKIANDFSCADGELGIVLFWPWNYTIDELATNEVGQK